MASKCQDLRALSSFNQTNFQVRWVCVDDQVTDCQVLSVPQTNAMQDCNGTRIFLSFWFNRYSQAVDFKFRIGNVWENGTLLPGTVDILAQWGNDTRSELDLVVKSTSKKKKLDTGTAVVMSIIAICILLCICCGICKEIRKSTPVVSQPRDFMLSRWGN